MRQLALLALLLFGSLSPACALKRVTIAELDRILLAAHGQSDGHIANQLSVLVLTERVSSERLARWQIQLPGRHAREALLLLADESAFLDLPPSDRSTAPPPDPATERQILSRTIDYVHNTIHNLPNFLATRSTIHFEGSTHSADAPENVSSDSTHRSSTTSDLRVESVNTLPLGLTDESVSAVTYRDGQEVEQGSARAKRYLGLTTKGEFGPILSVVLTDAIRGAITWGYWQQREDTRVSVFRYQVRSGQSHYLTELQVRHGPVDSYPAYHGEIAIDPASGSIVRLSVISEQTPPQNIATGVLVEYGPVVIGNRTYLCPLHGVALSIVPAPDPQIAQMASPPFMTRLNDVTFTNYHRFRADARILPSTEANELNHPPAAPTSPNRPQ